MSARPPTTTVEAPKPKEIPEIIVDPNSKRRYERGRFLGKGGFAKCYELKDLATGEVTAGKIVPKSLLTKSHQKEKMSQEIRLHKAVAHNNLVKLYSYFEDPNFVYIVLELCRKRSLMELHKRRKAITEPESRYFLHQILLGCLYLHDNKIIHRDLKLGNVFLNDNMEVKIGDFGLATKVDYDGERKRTLCGTPNYIAPEVLGKKGHSFEVDVWSLGCILYTLLVGKPPFETQTLKDTYTRIKKNEYHIPSRVGPLAKNLIQRLLQHEPAKRPSVAEILRDDFMTMGYLPPRLPVSCLTMAPRFDTKNNASLIARRTPLMEVNNGPNLGSQGSLSRKDSARNEAGPSDCYLSELHKQLAQLIESKPGSRVPSMEDEAEDPKAQPIVWVSKWVDYSDKYGFGYSLNDDSIGVVFNDLTKLLLLADGLNIHYIDYESSEHYYTMNEFPATVEKKVKLLNYFRNYMKEHLLKAGANMEVREEDQLSRIPALKTWFRTSRAVVMHLTNGTMQINFFKDHTKIILCPLLGAVTYIDESRKNRTFRFDLLEKFGCSPELASRLNYAYDKVETMMNSKAGTGRTLSTKSTR
eukprot:TRINITY_DN4468_c0_g1_i1.p1 TRINITY_DN4468_c0_g1~~TRINITY_DN4468_c0_g1_i1.p1  ORF type:complete len:584 (-),score=171.22 TRINITY_DN4468_c0_g1_i1:514-2265(-)